MTNEECFGVWAPDGTTWSSWAKPVLFADPLALTQDGGASYPPTWRDYSWLSSLTRDRAVIVDLPGGDSVTAGLALALHGYRPVPLYNTSVGPSALVDVAPIVQMLRTGADILRAIPLQAEAPPAFLLDADRMRPRVPANAGNFDNRWLTFPQDFPSATFMRTHGISEVVVLHVGAGLEDDLVHVLLRWQAAGIRILSASPQDTAAVVCVVQAPSWFRRLWYRMLALARLRRNNAGGFGAAIPSAGGGYG